MSAVSVRKIGEFALQKFSLDSHEFLVQLFQRIFRVPSSPPDLASLEMNEATGVGVLRLISGEALHLRFFGAVTLPNGANPLLYYEVSEDGAMDSEKTTFYALG